MKNIALIKSIVATSISSANPAELTGTAELTVRPVDQVELTCNSSNYTNLSFMDVARDMWAGVIKKGL